MSFIIKFENKIILINKKNFNIMKIEDLLDVNKISST